MATAQATLNRRGAQRGVSLVELLVGVAIGLFIAAAGATLLAANLREGRALTLESRLAQDLRTAADVVARDLRRAGYWANAVQGVGAAAGVGANPYTALAPMAATSDAAAFAYSRDAVENDQVDGNEQFGFRLRAGVIETQLGAANWQALTDATTLVVTAFDITPTVQEITLERFCASACTPGNAQCPPRQQVRSLELVIRARLVADARVTRSLRSQIRLRNDALLGACEG